MPQKDWIKDLPNGFYIYVNRTTKGAHITDFRVVLIYDGFCVTRYDTAHGYPHRDVLGRKSALIRKEKYDSPSFNEVFKHAIDDLSTNYAAYLDFFNAN